MIYIGTSPKTRAPCCTCGDVCFVYPASDRHFYCSNCTGLAVKAGVAEHSGFPSTPEAHRCWQDGERIQPPPTERIDIELLDFNLYPYMRRGM